MGDFNVGKATILMLALCLLGFALQQFTDMSAFHFSREYTAKPWILVTSMFLHANVVHLAYNLYALFVFGNVLEVNTNSRFTFLVIILGGVVGNLAFSLISPASAIGFSGSVYALIGAVTILKPNLKIPMPFGAIAIPAKAWFAGPAMAFGELVLSVISFDSIAHAAHFGGFIAGLLSGAVRRITSS
jgi:membrane associated rhomboid family serine protease